MDSITTTASHPSTHHRESKSSQETNTGTWNSLPYFTEDCVCVCVLDEVILFVLLPLTINRYDMHVHGYLVHIIHTHTHTSYQ